MATANSLSYPQGEDGACVERDEVLDINTEKSKNKQNRGCFGCISETAFFVRMPQGLCRKSVVFRRRIYRKSVVSACLFRRKSVLLRQQKHRKSVIMLYFINGIHAYDHLLTLLKFLRQDGKFTYIGTDSISIITTIIRLVRWINVETKNGVTYLPIYYIACIKPE